MRKLGPDDRLVGGAKLCLEYGIFPTHMCKAIAAGLHFNPAGDPTASKVQEIVKNQGVASALNQISKLPEDSEITKEVLKQYEAINKEFGKS